MGTGSGDPMSNLNQLVQWLDPTKVEVVTLEDLMVHLRNNFGTPVSVPGDYNDNGIVDAADYTVWRDHLGQTFALANRSSMLSGRLARTTTTFGEANFGQHAGSGSGARRMPPCPSRRLCGCSSSES